MEEKQSKMPKDSDFQQQRLKAWQPLLTPTWVIGTFFVISLIFMPIGFVILDASNGVVEVEQRYDQLGLNGASGNHLLTINIPEDMDAPIYFYYKLTNFYQNHRRYVKSRSDEQLRGASSPDLGLCDPLETGAGGKDLVPCGLIANSFFNDVFFSPKVIRGGSSTTDLFGKNWNKNGIAWESDLEDKFANVTINPATQTRVGPRNFTLPYLQDEDLIVWMRTAGLPTFKKLYRKIENFNLKKGDVLQVYVHSVFPVKSFGGEKAIVLSTTSWLGGKNDFLAMAYIIVGSLCLLLAIVFLVKHKVSPRPLGDLKYFKWNK